jgi:hypothetical protein
MSALYNIYALTKRRIQQFRTRQIHKRQWNGAGETELRNIARSSSGLTHDTSYQPQAMHHVDEADFVQANTTHETYSSSATRYTTGWRFGAINGAMAVSLVLLINLIVTIVFSARKDGVLFVGNCDRARSMNTGLHLLINVLSTVLLSSSNYCMQCLSAPTRKEVDEAHSKGKWLDIGVQSVHNLRHIYNTDRKRAVVWFLIGLSSVPLHLLWVAPICCSTTY